MSQLDQNVYVSYYSSVLAIKLKLEDADSFTQLYDEIIKRVDQEKVARIKDLARKLADELPLATLSMKIKWFESLVSRHGVEPLKVEKKVDITKKRKYGRPNHKSFPR